MWFENLTKDFGDFTSTLLEDTKGLASAISRLAGEVTGHWTVIAGDEDSLLAQECPLDAEDIRDLQQNDAVYLEDPCGSVEKTSFEEWKRDSVFSSTVMLLADNAGEAAMTCRQRLLDDNPLVLEKYVAFVKAGDTQRQGDAGEQRAGAAESTLPASLSNLGNLSEDVFFDRYFFRLSQLRRRRAAERQQREEEEEKKKKEIQEVKTIFVAPAEGLLSLKTKTEQLAECLMKMTDEFVGLGEEKQTTVANKTCENNFYNEAERQQEEQKVNALKSLVNKLEHEIQIEHRKLEAVFVAARQCGISELQMQQLQAAVAAAAEIDTTTAVTNTLLIPQLSTMSTSTSATNAAPLLVEENKKRGGNVSGASSSAAAVEIHQTAREDNLQGALSRSSFGDVDSWATV